MVTRRLFTFLASAVVGIPLGASLVQIVVAACIVTLLSNKKIRHWARRRLISSKLPAARVLTSARKSG